MNSLVRIALFLQCLEISFIAGSPIDSSNEIFEIVNLSTPSLRDLGILPKLEGDSCYFAGIKLPNFLCRKCEKEHSENDEIDDNNSSQSFIEVHSSISTVQEGSASKTKQIESRDLEAPTLQCPDVGSAPIEIAPFNFLTILRSLPGTLCTITLIETSVSTGKVRSTAPVARSYEGNDWEGVKGPYHLNFLCSDEICSAPFPSQSSVHHSFQISTFSKNDLNLSADDVTSRFLEQTTFGPTTETILDLKKYASTDEELLNNFDEWVYDQMYSVPLTSHREYFRNRAHTRVQSSVRIGSPLHICEANTRWHSYAFTKRDNTAFIQVSRNSDDSKYVLSIDGIPRTEVDSVQVQGNQYLQVGASYQVCNGSEGIDEFTGGRLRVKVGNVCRAIINGNPTIKFTSSNPMTPPHTIKLSSNAKTLFTPLYGENGDFTNGYGLDESLCDLIHEGSYPVYLDFSDGTWLAFDPRINLMDNTLDSTTSDTVACVDCPNVPRTFLNEDSCVLSTEGSGTSEKNVVRCGSPGEVSNDVSIGKFGYKMRLETSKRNRKQAYTVWTMISLSSQDQLRQRAAWELSQIFAISPDAINAETTEFLVSYYDIFVRNAFGSYRDVLKEVSYSPPMAKMLSYEKSKSMAYNLKRYRKMTFADENFAREIMQLFTIGTVMLNKDGSTVMNPTTNTPVLSYTNDHIASFARAWTGFEVQDDRNNMEMFRVESNRIDPMQIIPEWRDVFPKISLLGGHIGDGYPLCVDMPSQFFLRKGAIFRLLGSSTALELQSNPSPEIDPRTTSLLLSKNSNLYEKLCNPTTEGADNCNWQHEVVLDENIECYGEECKVETLRLLQATEGIFFEYVDPPCVRLPYYDNPKKISSFTNTNVMCADPRSIVASEACCSSDSIYATEKNSVYIGERMSYDSAADRCEAIGLENCEFEFFRDSINKNYFWQDASCKLQVKVDHTGYTALVHKPQGTHTNRIRNDLQEETTNLFPVYWDSTYPSSSNSCGMGACETIDGGCLCNVEATETSVFSSMPYTVDELLSKLHIGSFSPDTFEFGSYQAPIVNADGSIKAYLFKESPFDGKTIFEIKVHDSVKYYRNIRSDVKIVDESGESTSFSFRNPPHFMNMVESDARDAHYETDAVLDDYFYHPNTAPFLATFFIQRFGFSNPSPRYVEEVASAFISGSYQGTYGSGQYGDLGAMIAAIVLHGEARSTVLSMDPTVGSLKEPLLKVIGYMRSMKFTAFDKYTEILLESDVSGKIGQMAHQIETIFSFFEQDFSPAGPVQDALLVAPEGSRYQPTTIIGLLNGLYSMTKYGLTSCEGGFGKFTMNKCSRLRDGETAYSKGKLSYIPSEPSDAESVVNELATLLTSGRLNEESRKIIEEQYRNSPDSESALRLAQQLVVTSPEFHSTSYVHFNGESREQPEPRERTQIPYKAAVYLYLDGGVDSYNILVPHSGCSEKDMFAEYQSVREDVALSKNQLLTINAGGESQVCDTFGIHPELPVLQSLYKSGDALFFANTGVLSEPVTKETWKNKMKTQLFAHNLQRHATQEIGNYEDVEGTGILGRMADTLTKNGYNTGSFAASEENLSLIGRPTESPPVYSLGAEPFNSKPSSNDMSSIIAELNKPQVPERSGIFGKTFSDLLDQSLRQMEELDAATKDIEAPRNFPNTKIGKQLDKVSGVIQAHENLNMDRQFFMARMLGFDSHGDVHTTLSKKLPELNDGLESFVNEMKRLGEWDNVVVIIASDFGRTLTPNSGSGTDHGWGGNYFAIGGGLKGGRILGEYPDDLTKRGPLVLPRGRIIPTTSWDSVMNGVAEWMGINASDDLQTVLPNRNHFSELLHSNDLFSSVAQRRKMLRQR